MTRRPIHELALADLVGQVTGEMAYRRHVSEATISLSKRMSRQQETVFAFVRCINEAFFEFIRLLDESLRSGEMGEARLTLREEQPDLADHLTWRLDWSVKDFPLVWADLRVVLRCVVDGRDEWVKEHSATVRFTPTSGVIEWSDGKRHLFRAHREKASGRPEFGEQDFLDLVDSIGIPRRGSERTSSGVSKDDPEVIVTRRICLDNDWPGWREP